MVARVSVLALVLVGGLLVATSPAGAVTKGSTLANPANAQFGCEAVPNLGLNGMTMGPPQYPNGPISSCTWYSTGVIGALGTNSGYVPGNGRVTSISVRSGPNPAPLRFVVLRSAGNGGPNAQGGCCTAVAVTQTFTPTPNVISTFPVNLPVESSYDVADPNQGFATGASIDAIGVSATAGTGTLPIFDPGPAAHAGAALYSNGTTLPTMTGPEATPADGPRINWRAAPGWELLLSYEFTPSATVPVTPTPVQTTSGPTQVVAPVTNPLQFPALNPRLRGSTLPITLICGQDAGCAGRLTLLLGATGRSASAAAATLATQKFTIGKGRHLVKVKLSRKNRTKLRKKKTTKVTAVVTITGQSPVRQILTVRR